MKGYNYFLAFFVCLLLGFANGNKNYISIQNLRCEYLNNPLGIDVVKPRLSWELFSDKNNQQQTAYEIMVGSDSVNLLNDKADIWNSGKIKSNQTNQITYSGTPLTSRKYCYWKVRIWDKNDNASEWSSVASWSMGLLNKNDWKAEWIGASPENIPLANQYYDSHGYHSAIAASPDTKQWVTVNLGAERKINEIRLYPTQFQKSNSYLFPLQFRIEVSTDSAFTNPTIIANETKTDFNSQGQPYVKHFSPLNAQYIKIAVSKLAKIDSAQFAFSLAEIQVLFNDKNLALNKKVKASGVIIQQGWSGSNWLPARLTDGFLKANDNHKNFSLKPPPSPLLRKAFDIDKPVKKAVLYITALGLYEVGINGKKVGNHILAPEWTDYHTRVQYQTYNVTNLLQKGNNAIGATLADGWYAGAIFSHWDRGSYGFDRKLLAQLEISFEDGSKATIGTDSSWKLHTAGPIREVSIFDGEIYDAHFEKKGWDQADFNDNNWKRVHVYSSPEIILSAQMNQPIKIIDTLKPIHFFSIKKDSYIFDLGQNMVGWCKLSLNYNPHDSIKLRYAEVLNPDSSLYTTNLRDAKQTDYYIPANESQINYAPRFTYHGFRYVEVSGLSHSPDLNTVTGEVIASAAPAAGTFECSDKEINKLWKNIFWTQRGNLTSVPTDCPQRNERAGWMGDAQVFSQTAIFNMDMAAFYTKWVRDIRDCQTPDGRFPDIAPQVGNWMSFYNSPGWADAGVIVPWRMYENYNDITILRRQYDAMKKFIDFVHQQNPGLIWNNARGNMYGDWLNGDAIVAKDYPTHGGSVPNDVYSTAFFAYSTRILANTAKLLGEQKDYEQYNALATAIKQNFIKNFINEDGSINGNTQAGYALALEFGLVPDSLKTKVAAHMAEAVKAYNYRMSTGIQSTIRLMKQLTNYGYNDIAYRLLESHQFPSWFYSIDQGATTIWERWDGYVKGRGFQDPGMNSFNHVAFGAVGEWLYRNIIGINPDDSLSGYQHFIIRPKPGGNLSWAKGSYHSIEGLIASEWKLNGNHFSLAVEVPVNTTATVYVPMMGSKKKESKEGIKFLRYEDDYAVYLVQSGKYRFED